jgi:HEPN domain-containing protein
MNNNHKDWIRRAKGALFMAKLHYFDQIPIEDLFFNSHQAAEKALKGLLVFLGIQPKKTHKLYNLSAEIATYIDVPNFIFKNSSILQLYGVEIRYPDNDNKNIIINEEAYQEAIGVAEEILTWVTSTIENLPQ